MHLSDIGINVYLNTIQGALESFLSSNGPRIFPLQYQNLDVFWFFSLSISEVFVGAGVSFGVFSKESNLSSKLVPVQELASPVNVRMPID
jgi:hypothetical protein